MRLWGSIGGMLSEVGDAQLQPHSSRVSSLLFLPAVPDGCCFGPVRRQLTRHGDRQTGAGVAGATVTVTNQETGVVYSAVTGDSGFYRVSALVPGRYTVGAEAANFKTKSVTNIAVAAEDSKNQDVTLDVGAVSESVTVTAEAVALATENGDEAGSISARDVQRLPQNWNATPSSCCVLLPGVVGDNARQGTGNAATFIPGTEQLGGASNQGVFQTENQPQNSANGQRVSSNNYEIDGVSVNSPWTGRRRRGDAERGIDQRD